MKKLVIVAVVVAALAGVAFYSGVFTREAAQAAGAQAGGPQGAAPGAGGPGGGAGGQGRGGAAGRGGRFGATGPMTVELGTVRKVSIDQQLTVVGNLIGDATVAVVPKTAGRLQDVYVRLGDQVQRGKRVAKIEDQEIQEQVKQAEAAFQVANATIRQREADLALATTNAERSRNLYARQLLPKQTLDDTESRYQAAVAQLDLARAQNTQSQARLDELKINLANTNILSPVDGFVARRAVDPGAFVGQNAPVLDVVDIRRVRLVVNVVEKDLKQIRVGDMGMVNVDAFPGETFAGRIARIAPVLDPATRTAPIEIEIANQNYRLKPGMYARVNITTDAKKETLVVPASAVVDLGGRRGVFIAQDTGTASFRPVRVGIEEDTQVEIIEGVAEGDSIVTTGAAALTDGARFVVAGRGGRAGRRGGGQGRSQGQGGGQGAGQPQGGGAAGVTGASAAQGQRFGGSNAGATPEGGQRRGGRDGNGQGFRRGDGNNGGGSGNGGGFGNGTGRRGGRRGGQQGAGQPQAGTE